MEGLFAYPYRRVATPVYPLAANIRQIRYRYHCDSGFLCKFNTFASLLGGQLKSYSGSLNDLKIPGIYYGKNFTDVPTIEGSSSLYYRVDVYGDQGGILTQTIMRYGCSDQLFRNFSANTAWSAWSSYTTFGAKNPSELASLLGGIGFINLESGDLNTLVKGKYFINAPLSVSNNPSQDRSFLFVFISGSYSGQFLITQTGHIYWRWGLSSGSSWNSWEEIAKP